MNKPKLPEFLQNIKIILSRTSHPANIGSAARAMKTMGLSQLILVTPSLISTPMTPNPPIFDENNIEQFKLPEESFILASGAKDILENTQIVASLQGALADTTLSCALTSRKREITADLQTPKILAPSLLSEAQQGHSVALVFGNETFGLSIEEVSLCNRLMTINGNPDYLSLNLSQAVQVVTYELFSQLDISMEHLKFEKNYATHEQITGFISHLESVMDEVRFFEKRNQERLMRRMHRLFDRAELEKEEIDILRGFLKNISYSLKKHSQ